MAERTQLKRGHKDQGSMQRSLKEGAIYGLIAGAIFLVAEIVASVLAGNAALMPVRMFSSVLLGPGALTEAGIGTALVVGLIVHFVLAVLFGVIYGAINNVFSKETRSSIALQAGIGVAFGALVWLVNFQIIARLLFPWFLATPQFAQFVLHAVFFGLALGLMFAAAESRVEVPRGARARAQA